MGKPSPGVRLADSRLTPQAPWSGSRDARARRDADIRRRAAAGEKLTAIAADVGLHYSRVLQIMHEPEVKPPKTPRPRPHAARDAEIARRRLAGESPSALAAEFGVHPSRIPQIVHAAKETTR